MLIRVKQFLRDNELFKSLLEDNPDGFFLLDTKGRFLQINRALTQITGFTESEMHYESFFDFLNDPFQSTAKFFFRKAMLGEPITFEVQFFHRNGSILDLSIKFIHLSIHRQYVGLCMKEH